MTISRKNANKPAPAWFRKTKKAISFLSDAAIIILLASGFSDDSLIILIIRVGISAVMNTIEIFLSDEKNV